MQEKDLNKFVEIMTGLADIYSATLTDIGVNMRFEALNKYNIYQIVEAANQIVRTRKFTTMPVPADFIEAIEGSEDDRSEIQACEVKKAISQFGSYNTPIFLDLVTAEIMKTINWGNLCAMTQTELEFKMKEFKQTYKSYKKAASGCIIDAPGELKKLANNATKRIQ